MIISKFQKYSEIDESKIGNLSKKMYTKSTNFGKSLFFAIKREGQETKDAFKILSKMIKGKEITDNERDFLKHQSKDIVKILPLIAIQGIPLPIPIIPFLIMLGKKYNFDILPNSHKKITLDIIK